jgi:sec-independent protein translocase protein TatB
MFDLGFWEMLIIGLVALLVVGPERLPALATRAGNLIARVRLKTRRIRDQIRQELEAEHLKSLVDQQGEELDSMRREVHEVRREVDHAARTERYGGMAGPRSHPEDMVVEEKGPRNEEQGGK